MVWTQLLNLIGQVGGMAGLKRFQMLIVRITRSLVKGFQPFLLLYLRYVSFDILRLCIPPRHGK